MKDNNIISIEVPINYLDNLLKEINKIENALKIRFKSKNYTNTLITEKTINHVYDITFNLKGTSHEIYKVGIQDYNDTYNNIRLVRLMYHQHKLVGAFFKLISDTLGKNEEKAIYKTIENIVIDWEYLTKFDETDNLIRTLRIVPYSNSNSLDYIISNVEIEKTNTFSFKMNKLLLDNYLYIYGELITICDNLENFSQN